MVRKCIKIQNMKIKNNVAIIGFGKIGKLRYDLLKKIKSINITKIYDPYEKVFSKYKCSNVDEIFHDKDINIVFICTPSYLNSNYTCRALKNDKHVFCEKPPAINLNEIKKVINYEKKYKRKLMYGFNHRQHQSILLMKKLIESKRFGKILWARGRYGKSVSNDFFQNWRSDISKSGGGILIDQGIHMLDLLNSFCGSFDLIQSMKSYSYWKKNIEDNVFINLKNSKKNILCSMHSTMTQWRHLFSLEIFLEKGYLTLNGLKTSSNSYGKEKLTYALNRSDPPEANWTKEKNLLFKIDKSWNKEIKHFLNSINLNKKILHGNSSDALELMKLLDKIYK